MMNNESTKSFDMAQKLFEDGEKHFQLRDYNSAIECYREAASKGHVFAKYMLGYTYLVYRDSLDKSDEWFKKFLADVLDNSYCPNSEEQYFVGVCYDNG